MSRRLDRITDEAALWFVRARDPDFSVADRKELASWLAASAEHVQEYLSVAAVTHEVCEAAAAYDIDQLVALAREAADGQNVVALTEADVAAPGRVDDDAYGAVEGAHSRRRPVLWSTAAGIVLAAFAGLYVYIERTAPDPNLYTTGIGEQVSFPLDDGSVITLNAQSRLRVAYSEVSRDVELLGGEAMFDVAKDVERSFRVLTERAVVRAIGTQFNVRNRGGDTTVTVVEGIVDVRSTPASLAQSREAARVPEGGFSNPPTAGPASTVPSEPKRLTAGQQARVSSGEVAVIETNVQKATSWRERRLVFESWTLADVVAEFNLYNDHQFVIDDPILAKRAISGVFSADDRESFALFLSEAGLASSDIRDDGTIVLTLPVAQ